MDTMDKPVRFQPVLLQGSGFLQRSPGIQKDSIRCSMAQPYSPLASQSDAHELIMYSCGTAHLHFIDLAKDVVPNTSCLEWFQSRGEPFRDYAVTRQCAEMVP
ncbi:hypothetical protein SNK03_005861 [Fusarium graminearum]|uniref:Chromosome 2, complete genome n=1 Tax=Gibberella zeae (strain ATCC MYA-4620 / CBS 123657 / FGSC 9075 / NRRL 31084 / PH-1) TaxID=229533 RepID=I1S6K7_GIBZE|nr:hypothetical protein FGSG_12479 [Fusarium graminearum PH-1]ESU10015.1 hypothetical protein FGSG_12479 [Fusarium graminearum PH-1]CEF78000.1 unnamed protein product [Fusarium graminearum]|eukprot:XP_011322514.1 hypothetical protein FGSG_12479 [Fusarium graminearum PH-1]